MTQDRMAARLAALGNPTRLQLYRHLVKTGRNGRTVGALQEALAVPASTLAHHLASLVDVDLVRQTRQGRKTLSAANYPVMHELVDYLTRNCCVDDPCCSDAAAGGSTQTSAR